MDPRRNHRSRVTGAGATPTSSTTSSSVPDKLVGADDDPLIPTSAAIDQVFHEGRATWTRFVRLAESLSPQAFPAGFGDPSIMLKDVPALPDKLPRRGCLIGRPLWYIPDPEHEDDARNQRLDLQYAQGVRQYFLLSFPNPIECRVSSRPPPSGSRPWTGQRALSLLTMCWSYILSVRLLELQGRNVVYSPHSLLPTTANAFRPKPCDVVVDFSGASPSRKLVRWLCAILSPKLGWSAGGGGFPPWAAFCSGEACFVVVSADGPAAFSPNEPPPNSAEATELLIELCGLYGLLGPGAGPRDKPSEIPPPTAAFLAALALPFYRDVKLIPQFPVPSLGRCSMDSATTELPRIRQYAADLRYYMTLSIHSRSVGSVIWSIFWQPHIESNLVSPWPILESGNLEQLAKVFAFRRPRVASWWLGIFLLGDATMLDRIARYLETLEERWGFGSMATPNPAVAAWTGSPQSLLDDESAHPYKDSEELVSRTDLLRHRYNFSLQDDASINSPWRPFGYIAKELIELDLWPWLERGHVRKYVHWVWWIKKGKHTLPSAQLGFRRDTGKFAADVPDRLDKVPVNHPTGHDNDIKLEPSKKSTLRMIHFCMEDVSGDRDMSILAIPGVTAHPWLKYWRGLE
ncbi:hypothetical protein QBC46DRAFT_419368 [Diplogelasinospora grovesii]|uniref:Uncharacterized protein n=1 Tax=Diplogelasinospora grovesii TaxID=303347 RepID=A0AAN6S0Z0_9PEZI|nr:hypothetical protein QBC46DRAFT_419368 [Diplogelasinospora grovesii]